MNWLAHIHELSMKLKFVYQTNIHDPNIYSSVSHLVQK